MIDDYRTAFVSLSLGVRSGFYHQVCQHRLLTARHVGSVLNLSLWCVNDDDNLPIRYQSTTQIAGLIVDNNKERLTRDDHELERRRKRELRVLCHIDLIPRIADTLNPLWDSPCSNHQPAALRSID